MYFGVPSVHGKFGTKGDTPVNDDVHWRARITQEQSLTRKFEGKLKKTAEPNPDAFVKRPWTHQEDEQLREAVRRHGTQNWPKVCHDRTFLEMIANHTEEDVKARWRFLQKQLAAQRRQMREAKLQFKRTGAKASTGGAAADETLAVDPRQELRLKQTLKREEDRRAKLAQGLRLEQQARFNAEVEMAKQVRERRKLEDELKKYQQLLKGPGGADVESQWSPRSTVRSTVSHARQSVAHTSRSRRSGAATERSAPYTGRSGMSTAMTGRSTGSNILTARSEAIARSQETRLRARAYLETLTEEEGKEAL
jgi:hypothetical protein